MPTLGPSDGCVVGRNLGSRHLVWTAPLLALLLLAETAAGQTGQFGAFTVHGAAVRGLKPDDATVRGGLRADFTFVIERFSLGPEAGVYFTGPKAVSPNPDRGENVLTVGGVTRFRFSDGSWRPYLVGGLGVYGWESNRPGYATGTEVSGSLGLGLLRVLTPRGTGLGGELRLHQQIARSPLTTTRRFVTLTVGITLGW
jgi:hypothetical protein